MSKNTIVISGLMLTIAAAPALAQNGTTPQDTKPTMQGNQQETQDGLPSVEKLGEMAVKSIGGREALDKVKTLHTIMTMTVMGSTITMDAKWARDGGRLTSTKSPFGDSEMGTDGETAWMMMPGDRYIIIDDAQAEQLDGQASMHMNMLDPKEIGKNMDTMEVVGREEFKGRMCYKLRFEPKETEGHGFMFFDASDGRPIGMRQTEQSPMGEQTTTITLSDWKPVEGVEFFHTMKIESPAMPGGSVDMIVTTLVVNKVDADAFALPEQVKELAANADKPEEDDAENAGGTEISLDDLPEAYRERAKQMVEQMKAGGTQAVNATLPQLENMMSTLPDGDDKKTLAYVIQELKKVK